MKKPFLSLILVPLLFCACHKELPGDEQSPQKVISLGVSLSESVKTAILEPTAGVYPAVWSEGDCISVGGICSRPLSAADAGKASVVFKFDDDISLPFNIIYPASASDNSVSFAGIQSYSKGSFANGSAPMYGATDAFADVTLHHLSAVLRFSLKAQTGHSPSIRTVLVSSLGAEPLTGDFTLKKSEKGLFNGEMQVEGTGSSTVTLDCGPGVVLNGQTATDFFVCIPKGTYSRGFKAVFVDAEGKAMNLFFQTEGESAVTAGKVKEFPVKEFAPDQSIFIISDEADLLEFASKAAQYQRVQLLQDIDVKAGSWTPIVGFKGEFDGAMHEIRNLTAPLFAKVEDGILRNIILNSVISDLGSGSTACLAAELAGNGKIVNCHAKGKLDVDLGSRTIYAGGLVGKIDGQAARITKCSCSSEVTIAMSSTSSEYFGGIVAYGNAGQVDSCIFTGAALLKGSTKNAFLGGLAGRCQEGFTILDCVNEGTIKTDSLFTVTALGFLGGVAGFNTGCLTRCWNEGEVICAGASLTGMNAGGVAGTSRGGATDCVNSGHVMLKGTSFPTYGNVGGVLGFIDGTATNLQANNLTSTADASVEVYAPATAQNVSAGGILGSVGVASLSVNACVNKGTIKAYGACSAYKTGLLLGAVIGSSIRTSATTLKIENCINEGLVRLEETENSNNIVYAGGIIGLAGSGEKDKILTLTVKNCENKGDITRYVTDMVYKSGDKSFCGGIIGAIGGDNRTHNMYDSVNAQVISCENSGKLVFNRFSGEGDFKEKIINESYTGGITAVTNSNNGTSTTITCCTNKGDILSTAGYNGGIVGFVYTNTRICGEKYAGGVNYTKNSGTLGMYNTENDAETGGGYMLSGGICACLNNVNSSNTLEYCFNEGLVAASTTGSIGAGGIVGDLRLNDVVRHCKNSGTVRFMPSASVKASSAAYTGQISGKASDMKVRDCAVGGRYGRKANPTAGLDNLGGDERYLFSKFIYALTSDITTQSQIDQYAPGCTWWDGVTAPSWETE